MANPFVKLWRYLMALGNSKIDENADPKIQIQQAIEDAQRQHQALSQQAASVIGNQRQLEMKLNRQLEEIEKLQANTRQALILSDQAAAAGRQRLPGGVAATLAAARRENFDVEPESPLAAAASLIVGAEAPLLAAAAFPELDVAAELAARAAEEQE